MTPEYLPGRVALFGSGETLHTGGLVFEALARTLPAPLKIAVLETPAGFEPNSAQVAGRVVAYMRVRLQNYQPEIVLVPARKRNTPFSPDDPGVIQPLLHANMIFLGPGSPTYAARQLDDSLAWHTLMARHRMGATIVLASAATIAASVKALPVYEIYKVGEDLHWHYGLDLFCAYGLSLVFIPHWNNAEGGADLDTSHCFMGQERFERLLALLPPEMTVVGLDEHTALLFDFQAVTCQVMGVGGVTVLRSGTEQKFDQRQTFSINELGPFRWPDPHEGIPAAVWKKVQAEQAQSEISSRQPSEQVLALMQQRQEARAQRDWAAADELRRRIAALGWQVMDTPEGPRLEPM